MNKEVIKKWLLDRRVMAGLYVILGIVSAVAKIAPDRHNNFDIFRYVFYNTWQGTSLYSESIDGGFWDLNHYGPFFSLIIAPFAVVPVWIGMILWCTCLAVFLFWAISRFCSLPSIPDDKRAFLLPLLIWFCAHEMLTALFMQQFNVAIAAIVLLSFYFVEKGRDEYATLFIVIGTLVKLYGIVGLAFFFFSRHKAKYLVSLILWSVVLFCLPMLISSPEYQIGQYHEWFTCLGGKNADNELNIGTNISLLGIIRKWGYVASVGFTTGIAAIRDQVNIDHNNWWVRSFSDIWVILVGIIAMAIGYFRISQWKNVNFRMTIVAGVLMFICLFSTGSESSGYIIALVGCAIWYAAVPWKRNGWDVALMVFAFILTSLSPSDLFPGYIRHNFVQPLALKAFPVVLIWLKLVYELITKDYKTVKA